jgi:UDP:flavonoid glycosyltransferase YjiC (YdhE family)
VRITILALGSRGDVVPYSILGKALHAAGHDVWFITSKNFERHITSQGIRAYSLPGDADALLRSPGSKMTALLRAFRDVSKGIVQLDDDLLPIFEKTDLILNQLPSGLYGFDLAEKFNIPMFMIAVIPLIRTKAFPMIGWPRVFRAIPGYNNFSYRMAEQIAWQMLRTTINPWRIERLDLLPTPFTGYMAEVYEGGVQFIHGFSRYVVPRPDDWSENVHVTGYWFEDDDGWQPPENLRRFIEKGAPPLYIGFGSMPIDRPDDAIKIIHQALRRTGQRAILQMSHFKDDVPHLPDEIHPIEYAPHGWLFPRMTAVVHHGGSGTTSAGFRAGVPALTLPFLFDQFFWGARIAALGVGPQPIPFRRCSGDRLAAGIDRLLRDGEMRRRAAALGEKIRAEDGVVNGVRVVERLMGS